MPQALRGRLACFHLVHPTLKMRLAFLLLGVLLWGAPDLLEPLIPHRWHPARAMARAPPLVLAILGLPLR